MRLIFAVACLVLGPPGQASLAQHGSEPPSTPAASEHLYGSWQAVLDDSSSLVGPAPAFYFQVAGLAVDSDNTSLQSRDPSIGPIPSELSFSTGWGFLTAFGYDFNPGEETAGRDAFVALGSRVELEGGFRSLKNSTRVIGSADDFINDDPHILTASVNGYLDIDIRGPVDPYVGAGIGLSYIEFSTDHDESSTRKPKDHEDDVVLSYQFMAGINVRLDRNTTLYGGVRYFETEEANIDFFSFDLSSTEIEFGVRFTMR